MVSAEIPARGNRAVKDAPELLIYERYLLIRLDEPTGRARRGRATGVSKNIQPGSEQSSTFAKAGLIVVERTGRDHTPVTSRPAIFCDCDGYRMVLLVFEGKTTFRSLRRSVTPRIMGLSFIYSKPA